MGGKGPRYHSVLSKRRSPRNTSKSSTPEPVVMLGHTGKGEVRLDVGPRLLRGRPRDSETVLSSPGGRGRQQCQSCRGSEGATEEHGGRAEGQGLWVPPEAGKIRVSPGTSRREAALPVKTVIF